MTMAAAVKDKVCMRIVQIDSGSRGRHLYSTGIYGLVDC